MNQLIPFAAHGLPALVASAGAGAQERFIEFFTANSRNRNAVDLFMKDALKRRIGQRILSAAVML